MATIQRTTPIQFEAMQRTGEDDNAFCAWLEAQPRGDTSWQGQPDGSIRVLSGSNNAGDTIYGYINIGDWVYKNESQSWVIVPDAEFQSNWEVA